MNLVLLAARDELRPAAEDPLQQIAGGGGAVEQGPPESGEFVLSADAGEQLVVEVAAQPGQGRAHRGLAEPDALPGPGDVAFLQQGAQGQDEIEIEARQMHSASPVYLCRG